MTELPLIDGRRADVVALNGDGALLIIEIKSSIADFRADRKWRDYVAQCDRLYFAIPEDLPAEIMPEEAGLIVADRFGAEIIREPEPRPLVVGDAARHDAAFRHRRGGPVASARRPQRDLTANVAAAL